MQLRDLEIGVMFWGGGDPAATIRQLKGMGVRCGQIGIPGDMDLASSAAAWKKTLAEEEFTVVTVFCSYTGEDYADIPTVERTVGFIPRATRAEREKRTLEISDWAKQLGVASVACHIGFVPKDPTDDDYLAVLGLVRRVCDRAAKNGQNFALETGQEPAETLRAFFIDVNRKNLRINFDPANMILYGTGDPVEALGVLAVHVETVHCKDGNWPPKDTPGALGAETPLGQGAVGMERFIAKLKQVGYRGTLHVERETQDRAQRLVDIEMGIRLLEGLR